MDLLPFPDKAKAVEQPLAVCIPFCATPSWNSKTNWHIIYIVACFLLSNPPPLPPTHHSGKFYIDKFLVIPLLSGGFALPFFAFCLPLLARTLWISAKMPETRTAMDRAMSCWLNWRTRARLPFPRPLPPRPLSRTIPHHPFSWSAKKVPSAGCCF